MWPSRLGTQAQSKPHPISWRVRTKGIQAYIDTMPDSLEQAMTFGAGTAIPDSTGMLDGEGGGSGEPHDPSSSGSDGEIAACACSCDELAATDVASEDFKARIAAGEEPSMAELSGFMRCANTCPMRHKSANSYRRKSR